MTEPEQLGVAVAVSTCGLAGWTVSGPMGGGVGLVVGIVLGFTPWYGQPLWVWAVLFLKRARPLALADPVTLSVGRSSGGVRYQDGVAVSAIRVLGKPYEPTVVPAAAANGLDVNDLLPGMHQSIGLTIDSLSVVCVGSRRRNTGDYPRVYGTMLGPTPVAGRRETWLVVRVRSGDNAEALRCRKSVGTAVLAASHAIAAGLRFRGLRAHVATADEVLIFDEQLGCRALQRGKRRWHSVRDEDGWLTTCKYSAADLKGDVLEQIWSRNFDEVIQNVTIFPDRTAMATVTLRHARPPTSVPSLRLRTLPGQQGPGLAANLCGPRPSLRGVGRIALPRALVMPIGPSGVLLGRLPDGSRLLLPLSDPDRSTRVHLAATDDVAKVVLMRVAAAGERVTVHTTDLHRWMSLRIPGLTVSDQQKPDDGTTISVVDGTLGHGAPATAEPGPRPATVISIGSPNVPDPAGADVVIRQTGPTAVQVSIAGQVHLLDIEFFQGENRYLERVVG